MLQPYVWYVPHVGTVETGGWYSCNVQFPIRAPSESTPSIVATNKVLENIGKSYTDDLNCYFKFYRSKLYFARKVSKKHFFHIISGLQFEIIVNHNNLDIFPPNGPSFQPIIRR